LTNVAGTGIAVVSGYTKQGPWVRDLFLQDSDGSILLMQCMSHRDPRWQPVLTILDVNDEDQARDGTSLAAVSSEAMDQVSGVVFGSRLVVNMSIGKAVLPE
jgi:hypothetical protein